MDPLLLIAIVIIVILLILIAVKLFTGGNQSQNVSAVTPEQIRELQQVISKIETNIKEDFHISRQELSTNTAANREELTKAITEFRKETLEAIKSLTTQNSLSLKNVQETLATTMSTMADKNDAGLRGFQESFDRNVKSFNELQREKFSQLESKQADLVKGTETKLESIRATVEEKLEKTLSERLGQSFDTVGKQLLEVQKGLGEMQTLAQDVGGLKRVLSNVKMRGGIGEVQLAMLLEQILAPEQYESNVKTKKSEDSIVEFAIKLPGKDQQGQIWLPIDAKFPKDKYEHLQDAYDGGDTALIQQAQKALEDAIKSMAKDINQKYLNPPGTTDFGIMFLPFEGIYAEVVRKASLLEQIQREYKVIITGPSTLAAILNSLQMGFRTLAIEKRSSEVWQVLGAVKNEFEKFGGLLSKAQNNIQSGLNHLDNVMGVRTRAITRSLSSVTQLSDGEATKLLPDLQDGFDDTDLTS